MTRPWRRRAGGRDPGPTLPVVVDLDEPLADVPTGGAHELHVCVLAAGRPVGIVTLAAPLDPMPASLLAEAIERQLGGTLLRRALAPPVGSTTPADGRGAGRAHPGATVLVCTRDRPVDLARCLASLARLRHPVPVLVVDNGSVGTATEEVARAAGVAYVHEPLPGLDRARNRGVATVTSEVVLCTDDDVEVDPGWADALLACFDDPLVVAATGLVLPARLDTPARRRQERFAGFSHRGFERRVFDGTALPATMAGQAGAGAAMAFRVTHLRATGGFPEELDAGMPTASGGDTYALYRVLREGLRIVYEPAAVAFHHHRDSEAELVRAARGYFTGAGAYLAHALRTDHDPRAARAQLWLVRAALRDTTRALRGRGEVPLDLARAQASGTLAALPAYRRARQVVRARPPVDTRTPAEPAPAPVAAPSVRTAAPSISVVIPSRGRRTQLLRLLRALDDQVHDGPVEVVVSLDGDVDGSAAAVAARTGGRTVTVVQPPRGVGAAGAGLARNAGAAVATGELLVFLDDDVEPVAPDLLAHHAAAHLAHLAHPQSPALVVGPVPPSQWAGLDVHGRMVRNWWSDHTRRLAHEPALSFADVSSGNLSVRRDVFTRAGGFAPLPRREDWELGYRLIATGAVVLAAPEAVVRHEADLDLGSALADRRREGAGDVALARLHPDAIWRLPFGVWPDLPRRRRSLVELLLHDPRALDAVAHGAHAGLRILEPMAPGPAWRHTFRLATFVSYWSGVAAEAGGERQLAELFAAAPADPLPRPVLHLDDPTVWVAPPDAGRFVEVHAAGSALGLAPMAWGGVPWSADRFRAAVVGHFVARATRARALARSGAT